MVQGAVSTYAGWFFVGTMMHWGLHPWAIYALVGLSLGSFAFNNGLPLSIRSVFYRGLVSVSMGRSAM